MQQNMEPKKAKSENTASCPLQNVVCRPQKTPTSSESRRSIRTTLPLPLLTKELPGMSVFTLCLCDIFPPFSPSSPPHLMTCGGPSTSWWSSCVACGSSRGGRAWFSSSSRSSKERLCSELWRRSTLQWIQGGPRATNTVLNKWV